MQTEIIQPTLMKWTHKNNTLLLFLIVLGLTILASSVHAAVITTVSYKENDLGYVWQFDYDLTAPATVGSEQFQPTSSGIANADPAIKWKSIVSFLPKGANHPPQMGISGQHIISPAGHMDGVGFRVQFVIPNPTTAFISDLNFVNVFTISGVATGANDLAIGLPLLNPLTLAPQSKMIAHRGRKHGPHANAFALEYKKISSSKARFHLQGNHLSDINDFNKIIEPSTLYLFASGLLGYFARKKQLL